MQKWVIDKDWEGYVSPGGQGTEAVFLHLNIPQDAPETIIKIKSDTMRDDDPTTKQTHVSRLTIQPVGFFESTMC